MAVSFENVCKRMQEEQAIPDQTELIRGLDPRQRKTLELFVESSIITSRNIANLFNFKPRTAAKICADFVAQGFLEIVDYSNKGRTYKLAKKYEQLMKLKL